MRLHHQSREGHSRTRRRLWLIPAALLALTSVATGADSRPNVVVILADDLGYGDVGCYGAAKIPTPRMDRLAREGMRFTDAHSPSAVCTPTRYGLLTGRYAWRSRMKQGVLNGESPALIEPDRETIASFLKKQGYVTAGVGKWHLGLGTAEKTDYALPLRPGPVTVGFDSYFGIPASLDMVPYVYFENDRVEALPTVESDKSPKPNYFDGVFWRNGPAAPNFRHIDVLPRLTHKAEEFLNAQSPARPFLLYLPLTSPHTPWLPTEEFADRTALGEAVNAYGDFVVQTDAVIGRVLDALETKGFADNTLVIVTSDNGAMWQPRHIEASGHRANGNWRGQKADIYEAGHRVPFIVRWPGKTSPGTTCDQTVCLTDVFATLAEIVGEKLPAQAAEDSFSLLPLLHGEVPAPTVREFTIHHSARGVFAVRQGPWKAIFHLGSGGFTQPVDETAAPGGPAGQLYHLADDPQETNNLWQKQPEIVQRLTLLLERAQSTGRTR